jgi:predicted acylesterase/phospholipase RssA
MQYDLVFEGGGAKGFVFVGALQEFEERGHTTGRLLGTSAGAITACLLAAGYRAGEMLEALREKKDGRSVFTAFMGDIPPTSKEAARRSSVRRLLRDINVGIIPDRLEERLDDHLVDQIANRPSFRHFYSFMEYGGWFSADAFVAWLTDKLNGGESGGKPRRFGSLTLSQFRTVTGVDLTVVASDVTAGRMLVLNHRTAPAVPLVWAVRMSMSIPLLWQEVVWRKAWGEYRHQDLAGHAVVDGGLLSNFPLELFLSKEKAVVETMGQSTSERLLGMLIDEGRGVPGAPAARPRAREGVDWARLPAIRRLGNLVNTMLSAHDRLVMEAYAEIVVRLPAKGYGTTEFDMSGRRREALVAAGRDAMKTYFTLQERTALAAAPAREMAARPDADRIALQILE